VPSPLDPFLVDFLAWIVAHGGNFNPSPGLSAIAEERDWQPAFAEVLFTAARSRGLVHPVTTRAGRGKAAWQISPRGTHWLESATMPPAPPLADATATEL
jgi:hypothetical protein